MSRAAVADWALGYRHPVRERVEARAGNEQIPWPVAFRMHRLQAVLQQVPEDSQPAVEREGDLIVASLAGRTYRLESPGADLVVSRTEEIEPWFDPEEVLTLVTEALAEYARD